MANLQWWENGHRVTVGQAKATLSLQPRYYAVVEFNAKDGNTYMNKRYWVLQSKKTHRTREAARDHGLWLAGRAVPREDYPPDHGEDWLWEIRDDQKDWDWRRWEI
jgi:hypothetical protein